MHTKQYNRQMEKRQMIGDHTLVVGMDIGSEFNAACFMDKEGNVFGRYPTIYNSRKGFDYFQTMLVKTKRKHKFTDVLIGMEPTGHYWRKIAFFAKEKGYEVRFVRTTAVKHQRELDESSSGKKRYQGCLHHREHRPGREVYRYGYRRQRVPPAAHVSPCTGEDPALHRRFDPWVAGGPE